MHFSDSDKSTVTIVLCLRAKIQSPHRVQSLPSSDALALDMCEQSRVYNDGDIVWVKLSKCWWPGEVHDDVRLPADMVSAFKKKRPYAIVKFFQEDSYEYVKNVNNIYNYRSDRRLDFIRKGLDLYQANHKYMEMFPADVATAERRTKGNPDIINDPAVLSPAKQTSSSKRWAEIFSGSGDKKVAPAGKRTATASPKALPSPSATPINSKQFSSVGTPRQLTSGTPLRPTKEHEVRILSSSTTPSPLFGASISATAGSASSQQQQQQYKCQLCNFSSGRMNLLILHSKTHTNSSGGNSDAMARRLSLSTNKSMLTPSSPQKRFSTASSCTSTSSPALSPVNSPPAPVTVSKSVSPPPPPVNKSRPPKKRTKRVPEETPVQTHPPPPASSLSMSASKTAINTRRSRNRRRSSTPPPTPPIEETTKAETKQVEESPARTKDSKSVKDVALEQSLLKDWSDSDEEGDAATAEVVKSGKTGDTNKRVATSPLKPAEQTEKSETAAGTTEFPQSTVSGRSSPIRCRNIPKKDRREIILEEFEPKISPNRTAAPEESLSAHSSPEKASEAVMAQEGQQAMMISDDVMAVVSEGAVEENEQIEAPIVQKKKKAAAIERLSQQSQEDGGTVTVNVPAASPGAADQDGGQDETKTDESAEKSLNQSTNAASCFDFEEDSPPATVLPETTADEDENGEEQEKIKLETEKRDRELLAQIGNILNSTSELALGGNQPVDKDSKVADLVSPTKAKLADTSLPPKERGKRIFKSRNTNASSKADEPVACIEKEEAEVEQVKEEEEVEQVKQEEEEVEQIKQEEEEEENEVNAPQKDNLKKEQEAATAVVKQEEEKEENHEIVDQKNAPLPRKRKLDKQAKEVEITKCATPVIAVLDDEILSPEKKIPRIVSNSEVAVTRAETEQAMEVVEEDAPPQKEEDIEQSLAIATKPKINKSDVPDSVQSNNNKNNGESESPTESSPVKTSTKSVQKKVQLVQRVRTEAKVAKITAAVTETSNVIPVTTPVLLVEPEQATGELDAVIDQVGVNGSGLRTQVRINELNGGFID